ncbi:MAG TPA: response regulator transcription factor, partial [Acidimicrobiales bacterium]
MRVLIADDQRVVRDGLAIIVGGFAGTEVVGLATDGAEALRLTESEAPDVVLMDLRMPNVDGVEATRAIRERHPGVAVVVLTTYADDESI